MEEAAACKNANSLTALEGRVALYEKFVAQAKVDGDKEAEKDLQAVLDKYAKEKTTLEDKGVGGQVTMAKLSLLQQADATKGTEREQARTLSKLTRGTRAAKLRAVPLSELAVAQKNIKAFDEGFTELTQAWTLEDDRIDLHYEELSAA